MKVTGIELLQKIKNNEIKKGFRIQCTDNWNGIYEYDGFDFKNIDTEAEIFQRYTIKNFITTEFKILEENKEIEEMPNILLNTKDPIEHIIEQHKKINELVRAVNKLIKEREEK